MTQRGSHHDVPKSEARSEWVDLLDMFRGTAADHPDRGIYLTDDRGGQEFRTYAQLLEGSLRTGAALLSQGIEVGDRIVLALPTGFDFVEAFFGTLSIGAVPIPIAPPFDATEASRTDQAEFFVRFSEKMGALGVIFRSSVGTAVRPPEIGGLKIVSDLPQLLNGVPTGATPPRTTLPELAYIQITSGETTTRGAVKVSHRSVLSNLESVGLALDVRPDDFAVSWLPMFNTMGLVGGLLSNIYWGIDLALIAPTRFMRKPDEWLLAMSRHSATLSTAPSFAYHYAVRRSQRSLVNNVDLSSWRVAMVGGELVRRFHLESFTRRFSECGFPESAFVPVYGLAEGTLGVCFGDLQKPIKVDFVSRPELELRDKLVRVAHRGSNLSKRAEFVSVGRPLANVETRVVGEGGKELGERLLGEIEFRGPNVMLGYDESRTVQGRGGVATDGWVSTGDAGYHEDGELFVVGRTQTRFPAPGGRRVFPEDIELVAQTVDGVRYGAVVAIALDSDIVVAYEAQDGADESELKLGLERRLKAHFDMSFKLLRLSPRSIPRSPSGKIRRHLCHSFLEEGKLDRKDRENEFDTVRRLILRSRHELLKLAKNVTERFGRSKD